MKLSHYQLKIFCLSLWLGDIRISRASKSFRVNPDNEGNTIEINLNININGTNGKNPAPLIASPRNSSKYDLYLDEYFSHIENKFMINYSIIEHSIYMILILTSWSGKKLFGWLGLSWRFGLLHIWVLQLHEFEKYVSIGIIVIEYLTKCSFNW